MIDLKQIENEIHDIKRQLRTKENEYDQAKDSNLKEQFGDNLCCDNCAYSCCVDVGDRHTYCTKNKCIYCNDYCDEYIPENELSAYIREHHYYSENILRYLSGIFGIGDIMKLPEFHKKALDVLEIRNKKEG